IVFSSFRSPLPLTQFVGQLRNSRSDLVKPPGTCTTPNLNHNIGRNGVGPPCFWLRQRANERCSFTTSFNLSQSQTLALLVKDLLKTLQVISGIEGTPAPSRRPVQQTAGDVVPDAPLRDSGLPGKGLERKLRIWMGRVRIRGLVFHRQAYRTIVSSHCQVLSIFGLPLTRIQVNLIKGRVHKCARSFVSKRAEVFANPGSLELWNMSGRSQCKPHFSVRSLWIPMRRQP